VSAAPVTFLFTDLVGSTALLQRVGDEQGQRVLGAHRQLLREALSGHGGREMKWLGDGLAATFASVAEGVRCAVTMAQRARRPVAGERLGLRLGLHVGEALADEAEDYLGTPVVLARRLCDRAAAGQILCSSVVVELLRGRQGFTFSDLGQLELKGFSERVTVYEVAYQPDSGAALLRHTPFTGRRSELRRLMARLEEARTGQGGVVLLAGEPGIGKTRLIEEIAEAARGRGGLVLRGRCYEGEAGRPFGSFVEALGEYVRTAAPEVLRADLGLNAAPLTRLVPSLRERLADTPEPVPLEPHEERVRLLDAVAQSLLALANRVPTVLVLDDLHWADAGTVALLRHVARFTPRARLLVLGAYRDVEVSQHHPLTEALGTLPRETSYEQLSLGGLDAAAVKELVDVVTERDVPAAWVEALTGETSGNPFFLREVLLHLDEEGALAGDLPELDGLHLPDTVRQVIARRLERLSDATNQLLRVAAAFTGGIDFEVARRVAGLEEREALDALDAALGAQLLTPQSNSVHAYDFTHALVRHTLYEGLSPARQVRLHREIAEAMEALYAERIEEHGAEIAHHYRRSATLPGAERGAEHAITAADRAEACGAHEDAAKQLRLALDLMRENDRRRAHLLGRLGLSLAYGFDHASAFGAGRQAAELLAKVAGDGAAAEYLAVLLPVLYEDGFPQAAFALVPQGLSWAGDRRDLVWASLAAIDVRRREMEQRDTAGIQLETSERREITALVNQLPDPLPYFLHDFRNFSSREAAMRSGKWDPFVVGDYRAGVAQYLASAKRSEQRRQIASAAGFLALFARCHIALGEFPEARETIQRAVEYALRMPAPSMQTAQVFVGEDEFRMALDEGWDEPFEQLGPGFGQQSIFSVRYRASLRAAAARVDARVGRFDKAIDRVASVVNAIEQPDSALVPTYVVVVCDTAEALWLAGRSKHAAMIERNIRDKVVAPDFRFPMRDGRQAVGRLCALQGRCEEASEWFAKARIVLDEQGARPLRAIVDYDEALMYARRNEPGDRERARPLLEVALGQFRTLGMPGWIRRAETLHATLPLAPAVNPDSPTSPAAPGSAREEANAFHREGEDGRIADLSATFRLDGHFWTISYEGRTVRLRDARGMRYLALLLQHPGRELHVNEIIRLVLGETSEGTARHDPDVDTSNDLGHAGVLLDGRARDEYRSRLAELREEIADAERANDIGHAARLRSELDALGEQLVAAARGRKASSHAERARLTVTKGIKTALEKIADSHPDLGRHLAATIRRGYFCVYQPDPRRPITWLAR
jgi:class 3 adenylate cyclase